MHGAYKLLHVTLSGNDIIHIRADRMAHYPIGAPVRFDIQPEMVRFFDPTHAAGHRLERPRRRHDEQRRASQYHQALHRMSSP